MNPVGDMGGASAIPGEPRSIDPGATRAGCEQRRAWSTPTVRVVSIGRATASGAYTWTSEGKVGGYEQYVLS